MSKKNYIPGNDAQCQICDRCICTEEALRCSECDKVCHITCSALPDYILVMYMITRNQYLCKGCVQQRKSTSGVTYDSALAKIISLKEHEGELKTDDPSTGDANDSMINDMFHDVVSMEQIVSKVPARTEEKDPPQNKATCKYYIKRNCKYGSKGEGCSFSHPKKCTKFMRNGDRNNGCKKGKKCEFYHPPICWQSLKTKTCGYTKCKYHHLQGTRRRDAINDGVFQPQMVNTGSSMKSNEMRTYAAAVRHKPIQIEPEVRQDNFGAQQSFLELKGVIQQMQTQQAQMWSIIKDTRAATSQMSGCHHCNAARQ